MSAFGYDSTSSSVRLSPQKTSDNIQGINAVGRQVLVHLRTVRVSGCQDLHSSLESLKENMVKLTLPIPGDWHILKIFQPVIQKDLWRQLAQASGFCPSTLTALLLTFFLQFCATSQSDVGGVPVYHIIQPLSGLSGSQIQWQSCKCI